MIFLRSAGAVISTRLSCIFLGGGATCHSDSRISSVSLRKPGSAPSSIRSCVSRRASSSRSRRSENFPAIFAKNASASGVKMSGHHSPNRSLFLISSMRLPPEKIKPEF